jgi:hypothetical protein
VVVLEETTGPIVTRPVMSFASRKTEPPRRSILPGLKPKKPAEPAIPKPEVERTAT